LPASLMRLHLVSTCGVAHMVWSAAKVLDRGFVSRRLGLVKMPPPGPNVLSGRCSSAMNS